MKIKSFRLTATTDMDFDFVSASSVAVLRGNYSNLVLDLMREVIGDYDSVDSPDRINDGSFVLHADVDIAGKDYSVCYIRNADYIGDSRIGVNFVSDSTDFSLDDTYEYMSLCEGINIGDENIFDSRKLCAEQLPVSDRYIASFEIFLDGLSMEDTRPIFVYDFFDHIDASVNITPYFDRLIACGRQVFVSVTKDCFVNDKRMTALCVDGAFIQE